MGVNLLCMSVMDVGEMKCLFFAKEGTQRTCSTFYENWILQKNLRQGMHAKLRCDLRCSEMDQRTISQATCDPGDNDKKYMESDKMIDQ